MREELKKYLKQLYLKGKIDADRFQKLSAVADDLLDAKDKTEEYQMLFNYSTGDYPEFKKFLTRNYKRASEELESLFIARIDELLDQRETEKAGMILDMMELIHA